MGGRAVGKLTDAARGILANFLTARSNVELPGHLSELEGLHGVYVGDGRPEREVQVGFEPAFVVYAVPVYPEPAGVPRPGAYQPALHAQPAYTRRGFKVDKTFNEAGVIHMFVV